MTKPRIPKKTPEERPKRIGPGIPVVPKSVPEKEPTYIPEDPSVVPQPGKPEEVPVCMSYPILLQDYLLQPDALEKYSRIKEHNYY